MLEMIFLIITSEFCFIMLCVAEAHMPYACALAWATIIIIKTKQTFTFVFSSLFSLFRFCFCLLNWMSEVAVLAASHTIHYIFQHLHCYISFVNSHKSIEPILLTYVCVCVGSRISRRNKWTAETKRKRKSQKKELSGVV